MTDGISLTLPRTLAAVEDARLAVLAYLEPFALAPAVINRLEVVLEELVSNVVRHAETATHVAVSAALAADGVCLGIADDGAAFDPFAAAEPGAFGALEDARIGGLGIPLVKRLASDHSYARAEGMNRVRVVIAV